MNKKALIFSLCTVLLVVISVVFVYSHQKPENNQNQSFADWKDHFGTVNELINASDLIIKGKKIDFSTEQRVDMIFTKEIVEINKIYKGELKKGDIINILQTGGELNGLKTSPIAEAPILDKNCEYYLFLEKTEEGHYLILGGYQGVGKIKGAEVIFNRSNDQIAKEFSGKNSSEIDLYLKSASQN